MKKLTILFAFLILLPGLGLTQNQNQQIDKVCIERLSKGIRHENPGVRACAIFYAGFYKVEELVPELAICLRNDTSAEMRLFAAHSLYRIGNKAALAELKKAAATDSESKIKHVCAFMCEDINKFGSR